VMIHDPVAGTHVMLDPAAKVAHKMPAHEIPPEAPPAGAEARWFYAPGGGHGVHTTVIKRAEAELPAPVKEDLGTQTINGVVAHGTRTTMTIPAGKIGNDRPIQVVNERWYSDDLKTVVKSTNNDPRFGQTDYEMTNIDRTPPPASLFQIPSDYKVEQGGKALFFSGPYPPPPPEQ